MSTRINKAHPPISAAAKPLSSKERRFVESYVACLDPRKAALDAGYSASMASSKAYQWVSNGKTKPHVFAAVQKGKAEVHERLSIEADNVLRRWWDIATADPNELTQHRRVNCRRCHGIDGKHQWINEDEFKEALVKAELEAGNNTVLLAMLPTDKGGYGFETQARPNPACKVCGGEGHGVVWMADTRNLSRVARRLFAGVTRTKDGINIKMHDQMKALEMVARHLGMLNEKLTLASDRENPIAILVAQLQGTAIKPKAGVNDRLPTSVCEADRKV